jgi:hypothetical protein
MGTYSTEEWRELFGGDPEPGEAYLPLHTADHLRKSERENGRPLNTSAGGDVVPPHRSGSTPPAVDHCDVCGAPRGKHHLSYCDLRGDV